MRRLTILLILWVMQGNVHAQNGSVAPLIGLTETVIDIRSQQGIDKNVCAMIFPDGFYHAEISVQELVRFSVKKLVYEGTMNQQSIAQLEKILESESVKSLPTFSKPTFPPSSNQIHSFYAKIDRGGDFQKAGYVIWEGPTKGTSLSGAPKEIIAAQENARSALKPLLKWFHGLDMKELDEGMTPKTHCADLR